MKTTKVLWSVPVLLLAWGCETGGIAPSDGEWQGEAGADGGPSYNPNDPPPSGEPGAPGAPSRCAGEPRLGVVDCTLDALRTALACGERTTNLDENCCKRPTCTEDADCGDAGACVPRYIQHPDRGSSHNALFCNTSENGDCSCGVSADIDIRSYCVPVALIETHECNVEGFDCATLTRWREWISGVVPLEPSASTNAKVEACIEKISARLEEQCSE